MIATNLEEGMGLGNQLFSYVMCRVLALDLNTDFGIGHPELFKGSSFMNLDFGRNLQWLRFKFSEQRIDTPEGVDIRGYDKRVKDIKDNTLIMGLWQDENYWKHRLMEIDKWLAVEPLKMPKNLCVINFRGGEYKGVADLYLTHDYWSLAVSEMKAKGAKKFIVVTDDMEEALKFFPDFEVMHEIGRDWRMIRYANYLILSNSSFAVLPALLNENVKLVLVPRFWAGRNVGYWKLPQNEYKKFTYI